MSQTIYASRREQAAEAVAEALAEGIAPEVIGEAISLAANQLVLHDPGRKQADSAAKPKGSVHGASVGVHASDAANAWRNIARVSDRRNTYASLIVGAYHTAGQAGGLNPQPYPFAEHRREGPRRRARRPARRGGGGHQGERPGPRLRPGPPLRRARPPGPAGLRPAAPLRHQRGRRPPRREVLPHRDRGVRHDPPGLPLAATGRPGPRHGQRIRPPRAGRRRGAPAPQGLSDRLEG